ncbi:MAG: amino acid permease [Leptospiraceae bacterium]|nr:amino acid permease [Leptospiraceae bacterium]
MSQHGLKRQLGFWTATLVVIASMIGSGIFGNTGIIQQAVDNPGFVILLWVIGGTLALSGALCYAELSTLMPHAGGEYVYLKNIFGLLPSFLTGWVSFVVAFSAPAATAALLSSEYAEKTVALMDPTSPLLPYLQDPMFQKALGCAMIVLFTGIHMLGVRSGGYLQNLLTIVKLALVLAFVSAGLYVALYVEQIPVTKSMSTGNAVAWGGTGLGLLYVAYAYSGWNSAAYLAEEVKDPIKTLPRALIVGTLLTTALYVLLNLVYFLAVPASDLAGEKAVAALSAGNLFGAKVTAFFNLGFFFILVSTLSANIMLGPRVYFAMARDNLFFQAAARISPKFGTPVVSFLLQGLLAIIYIISGTYEQIQTYMGFALAIFPVVAVIGLMKLRKERPDLRDHYRTPWYPVTPLFFIGVSVFVIVASLIDSYVECLIALGVVLGGVPLYFIWMRIVHRGKDHQELRKTLMNLPLFHGTGELLEDIPEESSLAEEPEEIVAESETNGRSRKKSPNGRSSDSRKGRAESSNGSHSAEKVNGKSNGHNGSGKSVPSQGSQNGQNRSGEDPEEDVRLAFSRGRS